MAQVRDEIGPERLDEEARAVFGQTAIVEELEKVRIMCRQRHWNKMVLLLNHWTKYSRYPYGGTISVAGGRFTMQGAFVKNLVRRCRRSTHSGGIAVESYQ
jgi:hypothetical protein